MQYNPLTYKKKYFRAFRTFAYVKYWAADYVLVQCTISDNSFFSSLAERHSYSPAPALPNACRRRLVDCWGYVTFQGLLIIRRTTMPYFTQTFAVTAF